MTIPHFPLEGPLPESLMFLRTVEQVRRLSRIVGGFTLLLIGVVMLVTPGTGVAGNLSRVGVTGGGIRLGQAAHGPHQARGRTRSRRRLAVQ